MGEAGRGRERREGRERKEGGGRENVEEEKLECSRREEEERTKG